MSLYPDYTATWPRNPEFGQGEFRRSIRLSSKADRVLCELEDNYHALTLTIVHDETRLQTVSAEMIRYPFTTCPGATTAIRQLEGSELEHFADELREKVPQQHNCTYLLDLARLAVAHIGRDEKQRLYEVTISDECDQDAELRINLNGKLLIHWNARQGALTQPETLRGNPLHRGFARWAGQCYEGDDHEAAHILSRSYFIALMRPFDMAALGGIDQASQHGNMAGACFSYAPSQVHSAVRNGDNVRDFTHSSERLLKFL